MLTPDTTAVTAGNVLRGALRNKTDIYAYDKAYRDAFNDELPAPAQGAPTFEAAVSLLLGANLLADKWTGFALTSHALASVDDLITSNGGWIEWYLAYGQYAVDYEDDEDESTTDETAPDRAEDNGDLPPRDAPKGVNERTIADALVKRITGYPARWALPADFVVPRRRLSESVSTPFYAMVFGILGIIVVPAAIIGGLLWMPVSAVLYAVRRARGRI